MPPRKAKANEEGIHALPELRKLMAKAMGDVPEIAQAEQKRTDDRKMRIVALRSSIASLLSSDKPNFELIKQYEQVWQEEAKALPEEDTLEDLAPGDSEENSRFKQAEMRKWALHNAKDPVGVLLTNFANIMGMFEGMPNTQKQIRKTLESEVIDRLTKMNKDMELVYSSELSRLRSFTEAATDKGRSTMAKKAKEVPNALRKRADRTVDSVHRNLADAEYYKNLTEDTEDGDNYQASVDRYMRDANTNMQAGPLLTVAAEIIDSGVREALGETPKEEPR